jgi:hypothetical protein
MKQRRRIPTDQEAHEAFLRRIKEMAREDWLKSTEELSHAPEGVEDPWPPYDGPGSNGAAPPSPAESRVTPRAGKVIAAGPPAPAQEASMRRRRRAPTDEEVHQAVMRRIKEMTREDWLKSIEELSHAPEGVEDPWPPYDGPGADGSVPPSPAENGGSPERKK